MYRKIFLILVLSAFAVLQAQSTNLVNNPSFETGSGADPDGWTAVRTGNMALNWSKYFGRTGSSSLNINNVVGGSNPLSYWLSDFINVEPNTIYDFTFWYNITKAFTIEQYAYSQWLDVKITMHDSKGTQVYSSGFFGATNIPNQWFSRNMKIITYPSTAKIRIEVKFDNRQLPYTGNIYMDDFELKNLTPAAKLILLSPAENEILPAKGKYEIKWQSENIPVIILSSDHIGGNGQKYFSDVNSSSGSYKWTVPDTAGYCNISIENQQREYSIVRFCKIAHPVLNIDYPSGGESFKGGSVQTLSWNNTAINTVKLEYSTDNGAVWNLIADSIKSPGESYQWKVPFLKSSQCLFKVSDAVYETGTYAVSRPFSIADTMAITITSPAGGEIWAGGSLQKIKWTSKFVNRVKLQYSADNGQSWISIDTSVLASACEYNWQVPGIESESCRIRITDADNPALLSVSGNPFTIFKNMIYNPSVENGSGGNPDDWLPVKYGNAVLEWTNRKAHTGSYSLNIGNYTASSFSPGWRSKGMKLESGAVYESSFWTLISENMNQSQSVLCVIQSLDSLGNIIGSNWKWLYFDTPNQWVKTTFKFTADPKAYETRLEVTFNNNGQSWSGNIYIDDFSILKAKPFQKFVLLKPERGETIKAKSAYNIRWESQNISKITIMTSVNYGNQWKPAGTDISATAGSFTWTVPDTNAPESSSFYVEEAGTGMMLTNYIYLKILRYWMQLKSPAGNEVFAPGSQQQINWSFTNVRKVKIEYTTDNGTSWKVIIDSVDALSQVYQWSVPASPSALCKIKVSSVDDQSLFSINQNPFTIDNIIVKAPVITLTSPAGREIWRTGTQHDILWTQKYVDTVNIDYSQNLGSTWERIASNVKGPEGKYSWTINKPESQKCLIRISDAANSNTGDTSKADFIIYSQPASVNLSYTMSGADVSKASSFRMIGVPGMSNFQISQILQGTNKNDWQAFYDNGSSQNYMIAFDSSAAFKLRPGAGFWVISKNPVIIGGSTASVAVNDSGYYNISLNKGWNIISNPFEKNILWTQIQSLNAFNESLWDFNGSFISSASLEPYKGYYLYNAGNLSGLKIPYVNTSNTAESRLAKDISKEIRLKLYSGGREKSDVIIGFDNLSRSDKDSLDVYKPVSDFESERIVIRNEGLNGNYKFLYSDFRAECDTQSYDVRVRLIPNENYVIKYEGKPGIETGIYLIDERLGNLYDLTETGEARLKSAFEENKFRLVTGKKSILKEIMEKCSKPLSFTLENNFPNPFNPGTVITYSVTEPGEVILKVYDIQGKEISTLVNEYQNAGWYSVKYSVKEREISSGIYIYTLQSGGRKLSKKMLLLK